MARLQSLPLLGFALVAGIPVGSTGLAGEPTNLIANGGFEDGLTGWLPDSGQTLLADRSAARSGQFCLTGEVTKPNQHLTLRRTVSVKSGHRYVFEIAARATNKTKIVLWVRSNGERRNVDTWSNLSGPWNLYRAPLPVEKDGNLELEIVAPSSHSAPAGRVWLDDIALFESPLPTAISVSGTKGFNDEPSMARANDGTVYIAWNSFRDGADSLQIARYQSRDGRLEQLAVWQILGGKGTYLLGPRVIAAGAKVAVVYASEINKNWDIFAVECGPDGPATPIAIAADPAVDINPAAAWYQGTLWLTWESNRQGCRQIWAASLRNGRISTAVPVSARGVSSYDPSVAVLGDGEAWFAWHAFRNNNYDVFLRRLSRDGQWSEERRATQCPGVDRHAELVAAGQDLYLVYESAKVEKYFVGRADFRRIVVAKVEERGLLGLTGYRQSPLWDRCQAASLATDRSGRLWFAFLKPRLPRAGWDTFVTCFDGLRWLTPLPISVDKGMDRRPSLVGFNDRWLVAYQADNIPNGWASVDLTPTAQSQIYLAQCEAGELPAAGAPRWEPLVEPDESFEAGTLRVARGEDEPTPTVEHQGKTLKLFYGDLHQHSSVSVCNRLGDQTIEEDYQFSRDINRLDFACSTDHGYNLNPYLWAYTGKLARVNDDPGRYLTFLAEEWTSSFEEYSAEHPYGFYGHRNLILGDPYFPRWWNSRNRQTPAEVWEDLRKMNADFIHIPHQLADTGNVPTDWSFVDERAQPVAEIFQVRGSYEYQGTPREARNTTPLPGYFLQDAWARGIVIGVIASPDHGGGYGKACVFSPDLSRKAILESLRARRCFGTTGARILLDIRVQDHFMGEKVKSAPEGPVTVQIHTRCPAEIDRIEVCRNNQFVYTHQPQGREARLTFVDREPLKGRSYYYVRVIQKDEEIAWSSPVWFAAP